MNEQAPFQLSDLNDLDRLLMRADRVIPMREVAEGDTSAFAIGLRHDVDNTISEAVEMARWEAERGYRATYFMLHTAPYWHCREVMADALEVISECGHEIGFHTNAIAEAMQTERDPVEITEEAVAYLRDFGYPVTGVVAHGDHLCHTVGFVNDEMFTECNRPDYGSPDRIVGRLQLRRVSRARFGFEYDPNWLTRGDYLSDSGGRWSQNWSHATDAWPARGQLHMLVHPCWWGEAFVRQEVTHG